MAISYVSGVSGSGNTTTSVTLVIPSVNTDDLLIVEAASVEDGTAPTIADNESGVWTNHTPAGISDNSGRIWARAAGGSSTGKTITISGADSLVGQLNVYRGANNASPLQIVTEYNNSTDTTATGLTPDSADSFIAFTKFHQYLAATTAAQSCTNPGALTERTQHVSTAGTQAGIAHASALQSGTSATGNFTWTQSGEAPGHTICYSIRAGEGGGGGSILPLIAVDMRNIDDMGGMRG